MRAPVDIHSSDSGLKMKAEFHKIFKLFEELEEAGECATLTISANGAPQPSSFCLSLHRPHLQLERLQEPCHQLLGDAAVTAVQQQGPGEDSGQLATREPPWQRQHLSPPPLLIQEKPVLAPSMEVLGLRLDCRSREKMPSSVTFVGTLSALTKV